MPQMKIDRKFFRVRVNQILPSIASISVKKLTITGLQEVKVFLKNIAGGEG